MVARAPKTKASMLRPEPSRLRRFCAVMAAAVAVGLAACENQLPPAACGSVQQVTVNAGEQTTVTACFNDPNGDMLTYSVSVANPSVATASIAGASVTVSAVKPGNASVTVTASDPGGLQAQQSFPVVVPNRPPLARGTIPPLTVQAGQTQSVDVSSYFSEPDGEALTYGAASSNSSVAWVSVAGSAVRVTAAARGTVTVTVTATDPGGLAATQTFQSTVPNRSPEPVGTIPNETVEVGDPVTVDLSPYFTDPDGDALTYTARSSRTGVARVSVSGSAATITGVAKGTAHVTITATDPEGLIATQTFQSTVPNRSPEPVGTIPNETVEVGDPVTVDLSPYFTDPDGDALSYTASTSNSGVVRASVSGGTLTITAVAAGTASLTVTASDGDGGRATQTLEVSVPQPNRAPRPVGSIPARALTAGATAAINASAYFSDPDGDVLTYSATTSDSKVARASVSGSTVTIAAIANGSATVSVTARDPGGLTATQPVALIVRAPGPDLAFTDVSPATATVAPGQSVTFTFRVRNQGTESSAATTIRAMRSTNPSISTFDTEIASFPFASLNADHERAFPLTITVHAQSAAGTVYIGMCLDAVPDESDTRNNCSDGARLTIAAPSSGRGRIDGGLPVIRIRASGLPGEQGGDEPAMTSLTRLN